LWLPEWLIVRLEDSYQIRKKKKKKKKKKEKRKKKNKQVRKCKAGKNDLGLKAYTTSSSP